VTARLTRADRSKVLLDEQAAYWHDVETPYISFYAFEEVPAAFMEEAGSQRGVLAPMERLAARLSDQRVTALKPETDDELRKRVVAAYEFGEDKDGSAIDRNNDSGQRRQLFIWQQLFISYCHESPEHARAVRRLGGLLRQANIPVALDQFYLDEFPGGPTRAGLDGWRTAHTIPLAR
jgi:hypothetical protein